MSKVSGEETFAATDPQAAFLPMNSVLVSCDLDECIIANARIMRGRPA